MTLVWTSWTALNRLATPAHYTAVVFLVAALQLLLVVRFWRRVRGGGGSPAPPSPPAVSVIVACKGVRYGFEENIRSLLALRYPAPLEFLFVCPTERDPAYRAIESVLARASGVNARLLASNLRPDRCSGKIVDMLFALERLDARTEALAFADDDILVEPEWLAEMIAALSAPDVVASTAPPVSVCAAPNAWTFAHMVWIDVLSTFTASLPVLYGLSWAIRRRDFVELGIPALWTRCLNDDFPLTPVLLGSGRRIAWPRAAMPANRESFTWAQFVAQSVREFQIARLYVRPAWLLGGCALLGKLYLWFWFLRSGVLAPLSAMVALDMLTVYAALQSYRVLMPRCFERIEPRFRRFPLWGALIAPALPFLESVFFLQSALRRDVRWGTQRFVVKGPLDVQALAQ